MGRSGGMKSSSGTLGIFIFVLCIACGLGNAVFAQEKTPPKFREIRGLVLGLDGKPASNRVVHLIGLSRGSSRPEEEVGTRINVSGWDFRTGKDGRFIASFGEFESWKDIFNRPGWGNYSFIVEPSLDDAGAASRYIVHQTDSRWGRAPNEWGKPLQLPPEGLDVTLRIEKGVTLTGRVVDYTDPEKPLAGVEVHVFHDLHSESHTGYGAEIFDQSTVTDRDGNFSVSHIYPVRFYMGVGGAWHFDSGEAFWLKTKLKGKWVDDAADSLMPKAKDASLSIEIMAAKKPLFRYFGRVTDASGAPVGDAKVTFGVSSHREIRTHYDDHHYVSANTKADGSYEVMLETPWIRGIGAEAHGYGRVDRWQDPEITSFPPGKYDFTMKPN